jgi:serine protease AprX
VTLGATGLPNGISVSYSPATVPHANGSSIVTLTASPSTPLGGATFTLSGNSGTLTHSSAIPFTVNSSIGDFAGNLSDDTQNIAEGGTALYPLTIVPSGGFTGAVTLSVSGVPAGSTASFSQNPVTGGSGTSTLSIVTTSSTPEPQIYYPTITATSGILVHSRSVNLGVAPVAGLILGSITPSQSVSASAGGTANYFLNLTTQNNPSHADLSLAVGNVPAGASASFAPPTINTGAGTSTLSVVVPPGSLAPGNYSLLLTLTGSGVINQNSVTLTVNP